MSKHPEITSPSLSTGKGDYKKEEREDHPLREIRGPGVKVVCGTERWGKMASFSSLGVCGSSLGFAQMCVLAAASVFGRLT